MEELANTNDGIEWSNQFALCGDNEEIIARGNIAFKAPLKAGKNITFTIDDEVGAIAINSEGGLSLTHITYNELKTLRDNSQLVPGMFYRITDYQCTTIQEETRAMNHQFDIVVQALDTNWLSESASAV
jgi:hypothetical protein